MDGDGWGALGALILGIAFTFAFGWFGHSLKRIISLSSLSFLLYLFLSFLFRLLGTVLQRQIT